MTAAPGEQRRHPLDRFPSIKLKLGIAIVIAIGIAVTVSIVGFRVGVPVWWRPIISMVIALALVQFLARGMTSPLRDMADAAKDMARGDLTRRVRATSNDEVGDLARAFNEMAEELAITDRVRRDLIANVSHELRTPIAALQARLENLVDGVDEPDQDALESMYRQVDRLGRLVSQLLDLSRLESGAMPLHRAEVELEQIAIDASLEASPDHPVTIDVAPDLRVSADADRLHQVLVNLVANAARHGSPGGVTISASRAPDGVLLEVIDDGPGIEPAEADAIFERFYRTDRARASADGGTGLGLAITRWIVDLHGGRITVVANDPSGCRMQVRLPDQPAA